MLSFSRRPVRVAVLLSLCLLESVLGAARLGAQTDYYNTDAGRPLRVEDAHAVERRAFEIQLAPLRVERGSGGVYHWGLEPEVAYGIFPRTHLEIGFPLAVVDAGIAGRTAGSAGIDISLFHNLNAETSIPAFAIAARGLLPVGPLGPEQVYASVVGIATRTFRWARFHVNAEYTFGDAVEAGVTTPGSVGGGSGGGGVEEVSRWMAGVSVDRAFPLKSLLLAAEVFAEQPLHDEEPLLWNAGAGVRYQLSPRVNIDGGIGHRLTGDDRSWSATFGAAVAFGLPWRP